MSESDVVIVGAGHNGLVCALLLAKAGLSVHVYEDKNVVGGACRTERPFTKAPALGVSTGAYLLGLMPPELLTKLDVALPLRKRDPHYFLPTTGKEYLLFGQDRDQTRASFLRFFSEKDFAAHEAMNAELACLRDDVAPTWLEEPLSIEETAERHVRPALRRAFVDLCRGTVEDYLDRFGFESDLVKAMYAVTDGFSGLTGGFGTKGTGMNFLVHNMCRLPGSDGTWMIVEGGMGTVTSTFAAACVSLGVTIRTGRKIERIEHHGGQTRGVVLDDGTMHRAKVVVCNADPFKMRGLLGGAATLPPEYVARIDGYAKPGTTLKVNLALSALPKFTCAPDDIGQYGPTIHLLPREPDVMTAVRRAYDDAIAGILPDFPTIEWYVHTTIDGSLRDPQGRHNSALFVQWVPHTLATSSWEVEEERYVKHLLSLCDRFAPGTSDLVVDTFTLTPPKIEAHFGITRGHIHHVDNGFGFADRLPYRTPIAGAYSCSAGTHPGGSVIGCAGHNAAMAVLRDLGLPSATTTNGA